MKSQDRKKITRKKEKNSLDSAVNLFAEAGLLKKIKRSGWWVAGIKDPESVADHSFRCAVIAYYMAHLEKVDPFKAMAMALFNDIHEARINDLHKMGHHYIDFKEAEKEVFKDQVEHLDKGVKDEMTVLRREYDVQKTKASIVARDADILECLLQAKEYYDSGYLKTKKFFKTAPDHLKTKTAKALWKQMKKWDSSRWWEDIVKFER
ncbi:MAG: HD domain-containing protein [Candidatus Omnitrophica bacterium]|nr:HD domain-containing protein [Candidatus Omnitrophota bacterium]